MTTEVDQVKAAHEAMRLADEHVRLCFKPRERDSMRAGFEWSREFRRQFDAFTRPEPPKELPE